MHKVLVNRLGGLSLPRKSVVRLTDRPDMTLDVKQQYNNNDNSHVVNFGAKLKIALCAAELGDPSQNG